MAFSLALVDFDGTLADSMPYWLRLPADTLRAAGLPQPEGFAEYIRSRADPGDRAGHGREVPAA